MKTSFLFGAGISFPSKLPSIEDITENIFSGKNVYRDTDASYSINPNFLNKENDLYRENIDKILLFLKLVSDEISSYYTNFSERIINYEDIYFFVEELYQLVSGDVENPMIYKFLEYLDPKMDNLFKDRENESWHIHDILNFLSEVKNYIKGVVESKLSLNKINIRGLNFLSDLYKDVDMNNSFIFTLNHDLVLETFFNENEIPFCDGFSDPINNVRYWSPKIYNEYMDKIRFLKIHGSIDWYRLREDGSDWHDENICIVTDGNIHMSLNQKGNYQFSCDVSPQILVGTFNKLAEYTSGIFIDLLCLFKKYLNETDYLIISGYSFGDKGINSMITDWAYKSHNKRIIVINPCLNVLKNNAKGSIRNKWDDWVNQGKMKTIEKGIENVNWKEIKENLLLPF